MYLKKYFLVRMPSVSNNNPGDSMRNALSDMINKIRTTTGDSDDENDSDEWSD